MNENIAVPQTLKAGSRALATAAAGAVVLLVVALATGLLVRAAGAGMSCGSWPACDFAGAPGAWVDLTHRVAVVGAGMLLVLTAVLAWLTRASGDVKRFAVLAVAFALADVMIGAVLVWAALPPADVTMHALFALLSAAFAAATLATVRGAAVADTLSVYIALTKPRVISLLLFTTLAGMFITPRGAPPWYLVVWTLLGGYLMAGAANAVNMWYDSDIDDKMGRTKLRPIPSGRVTPRQALVFGLTLFGLSLATFVLFVNLAAAALAIVGFVYYTVIYTHWLKRSTWQNIVIGGGAGAIPPLIGWAAGSGSISWAAGMLFLIIFYWTPPHFWALALMKRRDYAAAGVPMLPVVAGEAETSRQIVVYSFGMLALTLVLVPMGIMGWIYLIGAAALGGLFVYYAWRAQQDPVPKRIWGLYGYSLLYLALLFCVMMVDRLVLG
jgi:protoheme IX farnesyltransferase